MADSTKKLQDYPDVTFIEELSFAQLQEQMIRDYEERYQELTGKETRLAAADPYRMILYTCAVALYQGYQHVDKAGKMALLKYSTGAYLDNIGAWKGVVRKEAEAAQVLIRFTLAEAISQTAIIPKGVRIKGLSLYFETVKQAEILPGNLFVDVYAACQTTGTAGNGFREGEINLLVDPLPYTLQAVNVGVSFGGTDRETDEALTERIYLSPSSYSTAGPASAYEYWVRTFSNSIGECRILSENPGEVDIYVTADNGVPDESFMQQLTDYLENHNLRPLTDHVVVKKPDTVTYDIELTYYISNENRDTEETIKHAVETAGNTFAAWQKKIGRDITPSRLIYEVMQAGAQSVEVVKPIYTKLEQSQIAIADNIIFHYGGLRDD